MKAIRLVLFGLAASMVVPGAAGNAEAQASGDAYAVDRLTAGDMRTSAEERAALRRAEAEARRAAVLERHRARRAALEAKPAGVVAVGAGMARVPAAGAGTGEVGPRVVALGEPRIGEAVLGPDDVSFGAFRLIPGSPGLFALDRFGGSVSCQLFVLPGWRGIDPFRAPFGRGDFAVSGVCVPTAPWFDPFAGFWPFDPFGGAPFVDGFWWDPWDFRDRPKHRRDRFDRHW